ncbi:uncharacterized protein BX664DRAFT_287943 [Halteromyces radiatus]|uniref:uncharacterized protein n=1 Tax=Halteromyces radiatus TaxID=101107 RepID=UPI00221FDCC3|nr:uncharacterized protein BX664DRAFT_287943 [Halteromyces radiatus]KAI8098456.1 hypothetical protein BX664DRAFT_287943 [Halteromyces radiatus]
MINEDEVLNSSGFLDPSSSSSRYLMDTSMQFSSPLYATQYGVEEEEDPWGSIATFDPVADIRQHLQVNQSTAAVDEDILEEGITAASVLVGVDLAEIFDTAYIRANPIGDRVTLDSLEKIIRLSSLTPRTIEEIISLVVPSNALYVTRNEFNTALALTACAQKNMELSLLNVYQHRNDLPIPTLTNLDVLTIQRNRSSSGDIPTKNSIHNINTNNNNKNNNKNTNNSNNTNNAVVDDPWRISSTVIQSTNPSTATNGKPMIQVNGSTTIDSSNIHPSSKADTLESLVTNTTTNNINTGIETSPNSFTESKTITKMDTSDWFNNLDNIKIMVAPEKEGFIFKHVNYIVESQQRSSLVLRRYSDFFWLWEVLLKRYPCRLVPHLPPKKISGRDDVFLEARRQGLSIFINSIARHPVLKKDIIFNTFIAEPSEFLAWRRGNPPVVDEEFIRINDQLNPDEISTCIPRDLDNRLEQIEKTLPQLLDYYQCLYDGMNKMAQLGQSQTMELERYSSTLNAMGLVEKQCYIPGCQACGHMTRGYDAVAKYMRQAGSILNQEADDIISGIMVHLKRHHDTLLAFKDVLERRNKLAVNQIDTLSDRIASNKAKVNQHRGVPGLEADVARLDEAIHTDQERLTFQQRRALFLRFCLASELTFVHKQQAFVSVLYQNYVHEKLQYSRRIVDNWKALEVLTCNMPDLQEFE